MNNSAAKVGEIFTEAGAAFNRLAEMTIMMHPTVEPGSGLHGKGVVKRKVSETATSPQLHGNSAQQTTLNMLNTPGLEAEVETTDAVKLEYVPTADDIATTGIKL